MTLRFSRFSPIVVVLTLVAAVAAQGEGRGNSGAKSPAELRKARQALSDEQLGEGGKGEKWARMTPEERLNATIRRDAKAHCRFVAACRPPKLMPGQSGTLLITAILQGSSVLPAPMQMQMTPRVAPESLTLGDMEVQPAEPGVLAKGYLGRPVYENTAIIEVPVTMGNGAKVGSKQPFAVDMRFDIYDGNSTQVVGRFIERVTANIEVGQYIDPVVVGRNPDANPAAETPAANTTTKPDVRATAANDPAPTPAMGGAPTEVTAGGVGSDTAQPAEATPRTDLPPTDTGSSNIQLLALIGGGAIFAVLIFLLMRRK